MTQEELARELGVTVSTINRWENGFAYPSRLAALIVLRVVEEKGLAVEEYKELLG